MRKLLVIVAVAHLPLCGCATYKYTDPTGRRVEICKLGIKTDIGALEAGTKEGDHLRLQAVHADGSESFKAAAASLERVASLLEKLYLPVPPVVNQVPARQ